EQVVERGGVPGDRRAGGGGAVQDGDDVVRGAGVGVAEPAEGAPVRADGVGAVVERAQHLVQVGGGPAHPLTLTPDPVGDGGEHRVELGGVDAGQQVGQVAEECVDLGADVGGAQHRTGGEPV